MRDRKRATEGAHQSCDLDHSIGLGRGLDKHVQRLRRLPPGALGHAVRVDLEAGRVHSGRGKEPEGEGTTPERNRRKGGVDQYTPVDCTSLLSALLRTHVEVRGNEVRSSGEKKGNQAFPGSSSTRSLCCSVEPPNSLNTT